MSSSQEIVLGDKNLYGIVFTINQSEKNWVTVREWSKGKPAKSEYKTDAISKAVLWLRYSLTSNQPNHFIETQTVDALAPVMNQDGTKVKMWLKVNETDAKYWWSGSKFENNRPADIAWISPSYIWNLMGVKKTQIPEKAPISLAEIKQKAKFMAYDENIQLSKALDIIAKTNRFANYRALKATADKFQTIIAIAKKEKEVAIRNIETALNPKGKPSKHIATKNDHADCIEINAKPIESIIEGAELSDQLWGRLYHTLKRNFVVSGSHGEFEVDSASGEISTPAEQVPDEYSEIKKINIQEYMKHWGISRMLDVDICTVGYWLNDGTYEYPIEDYRQDIVENLRDDGQSYREILRKATAFKHPELAPLPL